MTTAPGQVDRRYTGGMWTFGQILDRYATTGYGGPVGTLETIELAAEAGLVGLDLNYPFDQDVTVDEVAAALRDRGLTAVCVTPVIYDRQYKLGSFSSGDEATRKAVRALSDEAVDVAARLGAGYVKFWPGQDGYDYPFQVNYSELRRNSIDGVGDVARAHPNVQFAIEYKLKEPRNRLFWNTAATTLLGLEHMKVDNVGVVVDFGHSLFAKENPAEALALVASTGRLVDVELDDNYREWDDDLTAGSLHLVETLEFLYVVRSIGWDAPIKLDLFPYREDPREAVKESTTTLRLLEAAAARIDPQALAAAQSGHDAMAVQRLVRTALFG
jgi:xylose isomerase